MSIKINNAAKIAKVGKFPRTFSAVLAAIPSDVIAALTAKQLASLADAMDAHFHAGRASVETEKTDPIEIPAPAEKTPAAPVSAPKQYYVFNAFDIRENLQQNGAIWIKDKKAWLITDAMLKKFEARTSSYGMAWAKGWAKTRVEVATK